MTSTVRRPLELNSPLSAWGSVGGLDHHRNDPIADPSFWIVIVDAIESLLRVHLSSLGRLNSCIATLTPDFFALRLVPPVILGGADIIQLYEAIEDDLTSRQRRRVYTNYLDIATLLDPPYSHIPQLLSARAQPNERLARAFGLGNSFVSADVRVRKQFVARAKELLRKHTQCFAAFPNAARDTAVGVASRLVPINNNQTGTPFARFVQVVTMRLVIGSLLGGDIPQDTDQDVIFVVDAISELWASSKKRPTYMRAGVLERLNGHLIQWLPTYERPLDFVIPAYETMWRVVAVTVARAEHDRRAREAFSAYLNSPVECQYKHFDDGGLSVESFLCEVLRLHPPSRRLARAIPPQFAGFPRWICATDDVADLEALHQDINIWGQDGRVFDPMRFHPTRLSREQHRAFIPFGYGPLRCIAFKEAPHFAAIVAATILEIVDEPCTRYRLVCGESVGRRDGWEGWLIEAGTS